LYEPATPGGLMVMSIQLNLGYAEALLVRPIQ
jgi:hypothetical protein